MKRIDCVRKCDNIILQEKGCVGCDMIRRVGDKVIFESNYLGKVLATVDAKGSLYIIDAGNYPDPDETDE